MFKSFTIILLFTLIFHSCMVIEPTMSVSYDQVKGKTRIQKNFYYLFPLEKNTPFQKLKQVLSKEISENGETSYYLYDVVSLSSESFSLSNEVFLLIDEAIYEIKPMAIEQEARHHISALTEAVTTADSTSVNVVTGYQKDHWRDEKIKYQLNEDHISAIKVADNVKFRYYAGPHMMTLVLKTTRLEKFKEVIAANRESAQIN